MNKKLSEMKKTAVALDDAMYVRQGGDRQTTARGLTRYVIDALLDDQDFLDLINELIR